MEKWITGFSTGLILGAYLIDFLKERFQIKELEKELEDVRKEASKMEIELKEKTKELNELKRA